jgi:hypothetical protein
MNNEAKRREWLEDVNQRQKNVTFPDTLNNETRFWRNLIHRRHPLNPIQRVGVAILLGAVLLGVCALIVSVGWDPQNGKLRLGDLAILALAIAIAVMLLAVFLRLLTFSLRRAKR